MKTLDDFKPEVSKWLIDDWFPLEHRVMDAAPEGSFKTMLGCWVSVCIASGTPVFGHDVTQGPVLIIDEETPAASLDNHLIRFAKGIGFKLEDLPIHRLVMNGFRFGRKTEMDKLLKWVEAVKPVFIRMDSMLAMLPSGRQAISENDSRLGETIRDDLVTILNAQPGCTILLSVHSKKFVADLTLEDIKDRAMQTIVRGHSSIVGEGCDTGFIIQKVSEYPDPTRFCLITRARRRAIPSSKIRLIEMVEESYGEGWARLQLVPLSKMSPSAQAKELYPIFKVPDNKGNFNHSSEWIKRKMAFRNAEFCRVGVEELLQRKVIIQLKPQNYELNPKRVAQCRPEYLKELGGP